MLELAHEAGVEVRLAPGRGGEARARARERRGGGRGPGRRGADLALVLGGDGTILSALRHFAGTGVPVFAINFGAIGFLATVEPWELDEGVARALAGDFDVMQLPGLLARTPEGDRSSR